MKTFISNILIETYVFDPELLSIDDKKLLNKLRIIIITNLLN